MINLFKKYYILILIVAGIFFIIFWILWKFYYWKSKNKNIIEELKKPILKTEDFVRKFCTSGRKEAEVQSSIEGQKKQKSAD